MRRTLVLLTVTVLTVAALAGPAHAAIELGVQDDPLLVRLPTAFGGLGAARLLPPKRVWAALNTLRVDTVRINVPWARVAGRHPEDPLDLYLYDVAVDRVRASGRRVQLTLSGPAPGWATGSHHTGAWRPDAKRYAAFAGAVAAHFRGRVTRYSIWNEPNWWRLLRPQRDAVRLYRAMFLRGRRAIEAAAPGAAVLFGELSPLARRDAASGPLSFLRRITCSNRQWRAVRRCPRLVADGFAHHPYTLHWRPSYPGRTRDDVTLGSLWRLNHALTLLARRRALATPTGRRLPLYLTEWGYHQQSKYVREPKRSAYVRQGLWIAAHTPNVREMVWYQLAGPPPNAHAYWDSGLMDFRGHPRPVFRAVRAWSAKRRRPRLLGP